MLIKGKSASSSLKRSRSTPIPTQSHMNENDSIVDNFAIREYCPDLLYHSCSWLINNTDKLY